jgi:hypothetical protein
LKVPDAQAKRDAEHYDHQRDRDARLADRIKHDSDLVERTDVHRLRLTVSVSIRNPIVQRIAGTLVSDVAVKKICQL